MHPFGRKFVLIVSLCLATGLGWAQFPRDPSEFSFGTEAMLVAPAEIQAGGQASVTAAVMRKSGIFAAPVPINLYLDQGSEQLGHLASTFAGVAGNVTLPFTVPDVAPGQYQLRAQIFGVSAPLIVQVKVSKTPAILLETDKPIYKPGQTLHGRVLLVDNRLRPASGTVEISIHDAKGIRIDRRSLTANAFGVAPFDLDLAAEVNDGVWSIRASAAGASASRDIRVESYSLPKFALTTTFPKNWVLVDEAIHGRLEARYFFGRPVEGTATITAKRYVGIWENFGQASGTLHDGHFDFSLPAAGFAAGTAAAGGLGSLTFEVSVTDSAGHGQSATEILTVSPAEVILKLIPLVENLKPGLSAPFLLLTETPEGEPRDALVTYQASYANGYQGQLGGESASVQTLDGQLRLSLTLPKDTAIVQLVASVADGEHRFSTQQTLTADYSPSANFLSLRRIGPDRVLAPGEQAELQASATHAGTTFFDVYASGRTIFSGASGDGLIRFTITPEMAPRVRVVAYKINPNNEIAADALSLTVALPQGLPISASLDVDDPRPGDQVTLNIEAGRQAMVGLAIVDKSVLSLGQSRLHLGDVFAELDRRFMEPRIEIEAEPGLPPLQFRGAAEIFKKANLVVATSAGLYLPTIADVGIDFGGLPERADDPLETAAGAPEAVRVRQFFPETWLWLPDLMTDENGKASLALTVPDSITGWEISAVASAADGLGFARGEATVFQDFFVEPDLPAAVTRGEEFPIAVRLYNYLDEPQQVTLEFGPEPWFELLGDASATLTVPANAVIAAHFPIRPIAVGQHMVKVTATGSRASDAVLRPLIVEAEGTPIEEVENGVIAAGEERSLAGGLPNRAVADSGRAFLHIIPSPLAHSMQGIDNLLNLPFGCGEQNMIFLAPDVEILRYLNATGEVMPEVRAKAEYFINVGYQRQLTFQTLDGGFAAFGGNQGSLWLTAFVLSTFSVARDVRDIDEKVLEQAASMLMGRQNEDGSYQGDEFLIHSEMAGGVGNDFTMTAYTAAALATFGDASVAASLHKAGAYLAAMRTAVADQPYPLAIGALALSAIEGYQADTGATLDLLLDRASREGIGIHWDPYPVETTGYALMALLRLDRPEAADAAAWLATQRNALGGYGGSTQDTVVAIRALAESALEVRASLDLDLTLSAGDQVLAGLHLDASNYDLLQTVPLPQAEQEWQLRARGNGATGFQVVRRYHVLDEPPPPRGDLMLAVTYDAESIETDDLVDVDVTLTYTGAKERTGMVILDIAVPTGFEPERATLDALVSEGIASRVETAGRKVICYIDSLVRDETLHFSFQVRALYPVRSEPQMARAYEYYDPAVTAAVQIPSLEVSAVR